MRRLRSTTRVSFWRIEGQMGYRGMRFCILEKEFDIVDLYISIQSISEVSHTTMSSQRRINKLLQTTRLWDSESERNILHRVRRKKLHRFICSKKEKNKKRKQTTAVGENGKSWRLGNELAGFWLLRWQGISGDCAETIRVRHIYSVLRSISGQSMEITAVVLFLVS